jgi:thiol-disulfide isomerase/thioredoxin
MQLNPKIKSLILKAKPWFIYLALFLVLRYSGIMSGISSVTNAAILKTGFMDASPDESLPKKTFDYDFTLLDASQKPIDMAKYRGKTIFLNIWATWCGPCRAEMPSIQSLYDKVDHSKIEFVMLSLDQQDRFKKVSSYITKQGFTFPVFYPDSDLPALLQVRTIPTTFVINPKGEVVYQENGTANYDTDKFKAFLEEMNLAAQ